MNSVEIRDLKVEYRTMDGIVKAVNGLDITIGKGSTLGLVGETGAGKTTTALSMMGLVQSPPGIITSGEIIVEGNEITKMKEKELEKIRGNVISMVFQDPMSSLNPVINVEDQIAEVIEIHQDLKADEALEKAREMLDLVGIDRGRGSQYPHEFSGGMKQRVVIAIALACNPDFLIADEPTTALDVTIQAQVLEMIKELKEKYGTSMMIITHDLGIVAEICDRVAIMYGGKIVEYGSLEDIFESTKHPYTKGLFNSIPNIGDKKSRLQPIKGLMPDPSNLPTGCVFHPRCDSCMDICSKEAPMRTTYPSGHYVECHLYSQNDGTKENVRGENNE